MLRKKGFTLIEILVVVIIVGILASLAMNNYFRVVERGRAAEAKNLIGVLRGMEFSYYLENNAFTTCLTFLGFSDLPESSCDSNHYFSYAVCVSGITFNASSIRCTGTSGKQPGCADSYRIRLTHNGLYDCNDSRYQ